MSTKSLIKSTSIISVATASSRVLGFIRDILIANFFGTGNLIQAFVVAFRIPNLMRRMVGEGAVNSAFVPVLSEYLATKKKEDYWQLANVILNLLAVVLAAIVLIGIAFSPIIVRIIAPGFVKDPGQLELAIKLTRIVFPFIFLIGLTAFAAGVLNSLKHFATPAFGPCLLNLSIIATMLFFYRTINITMLAVSILVGGFLQLMLQIPVLYKKGMRIRFPITFHHPAVKKIGTLLAPRILGSTVYQLNVLVDSILASLYWIVGKGGIAALYYSNRLIQFPTAIFGIAVATAVLPTLSGYFAKNELDKFKKTISFSLKFIFLFMIPAAIGIMIIGKPIIEALFQRGEFGSYSTMITNQALFFYAIGLFSYAGIKILVFSFYSMQDTMTPVKTAAIALLINVILNLILMWPLKIGGLALATSISGIFNFIVLFYILRKRMGPLNEREMLIFLFKIILASLVMGAILLGLTKTPMYISFFGKGSSLLNIAGLISVIAISASSYIVILLLLRVKEVEKVFRWIGKK